MKINCYPTYLLYSLIYLSCLFSFPLYSQYYSQTSQDRILNETFFQGKRNGVFVDIGAYDGKTMSNTYFYEQSLGWTGICVEPLSEAYAKLQQCRSCITLNYAVAGKREKISFVEIKGNLFPELAALSGDLRYYDKQVLQALKASLAPYGGSYRIRSLLTRTLNDILSKYRLFEIDYLSIDIEGGELDALQALDFNTFKIHVMTVENNAREANPSIQRFLESKGFKFVMRLEQDEVYENLFYKGT